MTAPRIPCGTLAARVGDGRFAARFAEARRPGAYARVVRPGTVAAGVGVERVAGGSGVTLTDCMDAYYEVTTPADELVRLLAAPISARFRTMLERRLDRERRP